MEEGSEFALARPRKGEGAMREEPGQALESYRRWLWGSAEVVLQGDEPESRKAACGSGRGRTKPGRESYRELRMRNGGLDRDPIVTPTRLLMPKEAIGPRPSPRLNF